ncbi:hypothetical protein CH13_gp036 [Mycobacterium phage Echild]|uniref:hypothetical protein n=1 Tax=Mycobacterium phage Echild TaxID=1437839 RepID=UPI0003E34AA7|nr:hypothetical protein CH13_gp036 [Mycobacterium phage Echild]AHG24257.1 hypothetical protein PBI_ECHILD_36 [Mycobacterium phage Echild]
MELWSHGVMELREQLKRQREMSDEERAEQNRLLREHMDPQIRAQIEKREREGKRVRVRDIFAPTHENWLFDSLVEGLDAGTVTMPPDLEAEIRKQVE